jgi:hypothetical protein
MQRAAFLSFLGVVILLLAFTASGSRSSAKTRPAALQPMTAHLTDTAMLADRR